MTSSVKNSAKSSVKNSRKRSARILAPSPANLVLAAQAIARNEVVGMPTETVYGLAGSAWSPEALTRIFETKERPTFDPLILHVCPDDGIQSLKDLERLELVDGSSLSPRARALADQLIQNFWPGPLTLVLPKNSKVPDLATSGLPSVAIRMPRHPVAQALIAQCKTPLAAPSANRFGRISPTSAAAVHAELGDRIDLILDGGPCEIGLESTVLWIEPSGEITQLRPGGISRTEIESVLNSRETTQPVQIKTQNSTSAPGKEKSGLHAPGMLESHYAPSKPLFILPDCVFETRASTLKQISIENRLKTMKKVGLLVLSGPADEAALHFSSVIGCKVIARTLSPAGDLHEAARALFAELRFLDQSDAEVIFAEPCPIDRGLGHAIADRLTRASFKKV